MQARGAMRSHVYYNAKTLRLVTAVALLLLLVIQPLIEAQSTADTRSVLYGYDNDDDAASAASGATSNDRDHADLVALQSLRYHDDKAFLAVDSHDGRNLLGAHDITVRIGGRGRSRSDGISILRLQRLRPDTNDAASVAAAASVDQESPAVFTPAQLDLGWVETCLPTLHTVHVLNRGKTPMYIDGVRFENDDFSLASDVRGVVLAPSQSVQLSILFVASEPEQLQTFLFLMTSRGEYAMRIRGHTLLSPHGLVGLRVSVPRGARLERMIRFHNPHNRAERITEVFSLDGVGDLVLPAPEPPTRNQQSALLSMWQIKAHATKSIARFVFHADRPPSRYRSSVRISTPTRQFVVPIQIDVLDENHFVIEPRTADAGVFTNDHERREVLLTFYNPSPRPVALRELSVVDAVGMDVAVADLHTWPVVPPRSRVQHAVGVVVHTSSERRPAGRCFMVLQFKSNISSSDNSHFVRINAFSLRGHLSYPLSQTTTRVSTGTASKDQATPHEQEQEQEQERDDPVVAMGATLRRPLVLANDFNAALELERVHFYPACADASVETFTVGTALPLTSFPTIMLRIHPDASAPVGTRVCSLHVETNASVHDIPIVLYSGLFRLNATRNFSEHVTVSPPTGTPTGPPTTSKPRRQLIVELGTVAAHGTLEEFVNLTNTSPRNLPLTVLPTGTEKAAFQLEATALFHADPHLPVEMAALGVAWQQSTSVPKRSPDTVDSLAPGELLSLRLSFYFDNQPTGVFTESITEIETPFEIVELLVRFETVEAVIRPDVERIELPFLHAGRAGFVRIPVKSTFQHDVALQSVVLTHQHDASHQVRHDVLALWQRPQVLTANATSYVMLQYFPQDFHMNCRRGRFYADCFGSDEPMESDSRFDYSDFGRLVTAADIQRFESRERVWTQELESTHSRLGRRVIVDMSLKTDAMHTPSVRLTAHIARPQFYRASVMGPGTKLRMPLPHTELLEQVMAFLTVVNPSDYAIDMELAIAETDRHLFYDCDEDLTEDECVREWQDIARERVQKSPRLTQRPFAPLFLKPRVVRVPGRSDVRLGPVFFFPSSVGEWSTRIFIRNELTHIEPIVLEASSGLGELSVSFLEKTEHVSSSSLSNALVGSGDVVEFAAGPSEEGEDSSRPEFGATKTLVVTNSGTFRMPILAIRLWDATVGDNDNTMDGDDGSMKKDTRAFAFIAGRAADENADAVPARRMRFWDVETFVLEPQQKLRVEVEFTSDCFRSQRETELQITTRDGVTRHRLVGTLRVDASFACRRQHAWWSAWSSTVRRVEAVRWLWTAVVTAGVLSVILALYTLVRTRRGSRTRTRSHWTDPTATSSNVNIRGSSPTNEELPSASDDGDRELLSQLSRMERSSSVPSPSSSDGTARKPPTVAKLLASRRARGAKAAHRERRQRLDAVGVAAVAATDDVRSVEGGGGEEVKSLKDTSSEQQPEEDEEVDAVAETSSARARALPHKRHNSSGSRKKSARPASPPTDNQKSDDDADPAVDPSVASSGLVEPKSFVASKTELLPIFATKEVEKETEKEEEEEEEEVDEGNDRIENKEADDKDASFREDTASEEESDGYQRDADDVVESPNQHVQANDDTDAALVDALFLPPLELSLNAIAQPDESLSFEDEWIGFDSLQSEIGKLLVTDDSALEEEEESPIGSSASRKEPISSSRQPSVERSALPSMSSLSMAPPLLPMSSLFGSTVGPLVAPPSALPALPALPALAVHLSRTQKPKAAPPGFSPADANPQASRAVFERLLQPPAASLPASSLDAFCVPAISDGASLQSPFSGRYSLFGSRLEDPGSTGLESSSLFHTPHSSSIGSGLLNGRIGSSRVTQNGFVASAFATPSPRNSQRDRPHNSQLASLGGIEFSRRDTAARSKAEEN